MTSSPVDEVSEKDKRWFLRQEGRYCALSSLLLASPTPPPQRLPSLPPHCLLRSGDNSLSSWLSFCSKDNPFPALRDWCAGTKQIVFQLSIFSFLPRQVAWRNFVFFLAFLSCHRQKICISHHLFGIFRFLWLQQFRYKKLSITVAEISFCSPGKLTYQLATPLSSEKC